VTWTPGYLAVVSLAHLNNASRADTFGSWPTTISDICRKKKGGLFWGEISTVTAVLSCIQQETQTASFTKYTMYVLNIQKVKSTELEKVPRILVWQIYA
jgi:hypothetical protein